MNKSKFHFVMSFPHISSAKLLISTRFSIKTFRNDTLLFEPITMHLVASVISFYKCTIIKYTYTKTSWAFNKEWRSCI